MSDDLASVLVNVRKAYRLLNAYHRRIIGTVYQIGDNMKIDFRWWRAEPEHWTRRVSTTLRYDERAYLQLMPLYRARFVFTSSEWHEAEAGQWLLEVCHAGDTDYNPNIFDYDPIQMKDPEATASELSLSAAIVCSGAGGDWWKLWEEECPSLDSVDAQANIRVFEGSRVWFGQPAGFNVRMVTRNWSVTEFADEAALKQRCAEFKSLVTAVKNLPAPPE
ncbi:MAG: hypothetical protein ACLQME_15870 [Alphaproteobacteria bacterium]